MPFSFTNKSQGDLIRSQDWNTAMAAIVALYDRLHGTTGHRHTGSAEDGPQIPPGGLQDLAVITAKLNDLAVTTPKINDGAVTTPKLGPGAVDGTKLAAGSVGNTHIVAGSVDNAKLAANSVGSGQLQAGSVIAGKVGNAAIGNNQLIDLSVSVNKLVDGSVTTPKIADGQVTAAKLAAGVAPAMGIAVSFLQVSGQFAAVPSGFVASECRFFCALNWVRAGIPAAPTGVIHYYATVDAAGQITFFDFTSYADKGCGFTVVALAKRGGW